MHLSPLFRFAEAKPMLRYIQAVAGGQSMDSNRSGSDRGKEGQESKSDGGGDSGSASAEAAEAAAAAAEWTGLEPSCGPLRTVLMINGLL